MASSSGDYINNTTQGTPSVVAFSLASQQKSEREETTEQDYVSAYTSDLFGWAVYHGHTAVVVLLLSERVTSWYGDLLRKADSDKNRVKLLRRTLKYINYCGNEETAQLLLDSLLETVDRNERVFEALCESAEAGWEMVVRLLLRGNESLKLKQNNNGDNALHIAAGNNHSIVVEECLKLGFDIDAKDRSGETPLMTAINSKSEQVVALLLDKGANANAKNVQGQRITHAAFMSRLSEETIQQVLAKAFEAHSLKQSHLFQSNTKWRRADVVVERDPLLTARIFVDAYYAFFEAPQKFSSNGVIERHRKCILFLQDKGPSRRLSCILFHPYPDASLDISVARYLDGDTWIESLRLKGIESLRLKGSELQEWNEKKRHKLLRFRIVNGGEFSVNWGDGSQAFYEYYSFKDVATDPNAVLVDSDIDPRTSGKLVDYNAEEC